MILFGFKACGKTYFGKRLAEKLRLEFIDTDQRIEEAYAKEKGEVLTCRQIAKKEGEFFFRALERAVIDAIKPGVRRIISVGGGAMLDPRNLDKLKTLGQLVYLEAPKETLKARLFAGEWPSFLDAKNPEESFEKMYALRKPLYEAIVAKKVNLQGRSEEEVIEKLVQHYGK